MMNSNDLSIKLGVPTFKELKRIITKRTHNICELRKNKIYYDSEHQIFWLSQPTNTNLRKKVQKLKNKGIERISSLFVTGKIKGWRVLLSSKNPKEYKKHDLIEYKKDIIPINRELERLKLDRGHLLADRFSNAIIIKSSMSQPNGTSTVFSLKRT